MFVLDKHHYRPAEEEPRGNPGMKTGGAEKGSCAARTQPNVKEYAWTPGVKRSSSSA
jgi:hypothetical protein